MGMPWTLREVARGRRPSTTALRMLASQRDFAVRSRTKAANRLRAVLLEADPAFEAAVDPSSRWQLAVLAELGGAFGIRAAGLRRFRSGRRALLRRAQGRPPTASGPRRPRRRPPAGPSSPDPRESASSCAPLCRQGFSPYGGEAARLDGLISDSLAGDETYEALLPRCRAWGPRTAAALVTLVGRVAVPEPRRARRLHGARALQQAVGHVPQLDLSRPGAATGPSRTCSSTPAPPSWAPRGASGGTTAECRARGMRHNKALKAVARKRLKVIFAVMRDRVPYREG